MENYDYGKFDIDLLEKIKSELLDTNKINKGTLFLILSLKNKIQIAFYIEIILNI